MEKRVVRAGVQSGSVIFLTILTVFVVPAITENAEAIDVLQDKVSGDKIDRILDKIEKIEDKIDKNNSVLCYLSEGKYCD